MTCSFFVGQYSCYSVSVDSAALSHYASALETSEPQLALWCLARAIASSHAWSEGADLNLVVRPGQQPELVLVGEVDEVLESRLEVQVRGLNHACRNLRYVTYDRAQQDCQILARRLVERFSEAELRGFRFASIPRGGSIVLGLLAYVLNLKRAQLERPHPVDIPLVVVDDCSLTGARFSQFINTCENQLVVFAPLYSHPDLRTTIESRESKVLASVSAQDLYDSGPEQLKDRYPAWKERWRHHLKGHRYWVGLCEHVCFAWNEPDRFLWNPASQQVEAGWRIVPPELCLKNRSHVSSSRLQVREQPEAAGPLGPPSGVFYCEYQGHTVVGNLKTGETIGLDGVGADIWWAIVEQGNRESVLQALLSDYEVDRETMEVDFRAFLDDLLARGLLQDDMKLSREVCI